MAGSLRWAGVATLAVGALAMWAWLPAADADLILSNGVVELGVRDDAALITTGGTASCWAAVSGGAYPPGPPPPCTGGTTKVGLRFKGTDGEATADGCACETWGVSYDGSVSGFARGTNAGPGAGLAGVTALAQPAPGTAVSVRRAGDLQVTHDFHPAAATPNLYEVTVTIENLGTVAHNDVRYRRAMDWDVQPTAFADIVTIDWPGPGSADLLLRSSDNGFASGNPLSAIGGLASIPTNPAIADQGPSDRGAAFDFKLGDLLPGQSLFFTIYYGAAADEAGALAALTAVGAQVWSLGQPSSDGGAQSGTPNTFMFAFAGVDPPEPTLDFSWVAATGCMDSAVRFDAHPQNVVGLQSIAWDFGDGVAGTGVAPAHTYVAAGTYQVTAIVTDAAGLTYAATHAVQAEADTDCCPSLFAVSKVTGEAGHVVRITLNPVDPEGSDLTFTVTPGLPEGASLHEATATFTWVTRPKDAGTHHLTFQVSDGHAHAEPCADTRVIEVELLPWTGPGRAPDSDGDGIEDGSDNCPGTANRLQEDADRNGTGDACEETEDSATAPPATGTFMAKPGDEDGDGVADASDNCARPNPDQGDFDHDRVGDACDPDQDGDGALDAGPAGMLLDNCPLVPNVDQADADGDGRGDRCDAPPGQVAAARRPDSEGGIQAAAGNPSPLVVALLAAVALAGAIGAFLVLRRRRGR